MRKQRMTGAAMLAAGLLTFAGCAESSSDVFEPTAHHTNPVMTGSTAAETESSAETQTEAESETDRRIEALWRSDPYRTVTAEDGGDRYPVSVNCVTIGSSFETLAAQIGAGETEDGSGFFRVQFHSESI